MNSFLKRSSYLLTHKARSHCANAQASVMHPSEVTTIVALCLGTMKLLRWTMPSWPHTVLAAAVPRPPALTRVVAFPSQLPQSQDCLGEPEKTQFLSLM